MSLPLLLLLLLALLSCHIWSGGSAGDFNDKSPFAQSLPDCSLASSRTKFIQKKTDAKAIVCPMFKDEEGFLAEWLAYYQVHGFDHVILFDDGSIDQSLLEVKPWIDSGYVHVVSNWTASGSDQHSLNISEHFLRNEFKKNMAIKAVLETTCKLWAIKEGYDYHVSLDIDEYIMPNAPGVTVVDDLVRWTNETGRGVYCIEKLNFQSAPHLLEPVHLLQIEAYQTRMKSEKRMNYYTTVAPKCAYKLRSTEYTNVSAEFVAHCCHFHGCQGHDFTAYSTFCKNQFGNEAWRVNGKGKPWKDGMRINHYSRSLEKYAIKGKTWKTSSGEIKAGETSVDAAKNYDISKFFSRSLGWYHDEMALRYSCQVREKLREMTGEDKFLRFGTGWYRNPEFGKDVGDPDKRGRYGRPNAPGFKFHDGNPYHYHGKGGYFVDNAGPKASQPE